ncbi:DNA polymerase III subunit chi [Roseovarius albus]|uniref:DNA polymerase III subunit chi n=1 Tax=Roseovarius albus TaxID=1247867 RepID=A0A1X6YBD0_9RHOB|nr:DNA polymerase III subunit chi [Roseovarius albus]SLN16253.1 DNA polymerase III subunit chi [Roseovarius albus]
MGAAYFYHLTRKPLEATLPVLLEKALGAGLRVAVRGTDQARLNWLDEKLWLGPEEGFLPHGLSGGSHDTDQPILLTTEQQASNLAQCVMIIDGAEVSADEVSALERVCILFDGNDPEALNVARGQWKALTVAGCSAQYWSEESGNWQKKAESG